MRATTHLALGAVAACLGPVLPLPLGPSSPFRQSLSLRHPEAPFRGAMAEQQVRETLQFINHPRVDVRSFGLLSAQLTSAGAAHGRGAREVDDPGRP